MNVRQQKKQTTYTDGFTLVETLVAISILLVVIIGPMTIAQKGMQNAFYAGDQTTAVYLAQEGIEYIQRLRDNNALNEFTDYQNSGSNNNGNTQSWYISLDADCKDADGCDVNFESNSFNDCSTANACKLEIALTPTTRVYGYGTGWPTSMYERRIRVGTFANGGYPVTVTVSWTANIFGNVSNNARAVTLQSYIYDHYKRYE